MHFSSANDEEEFIFCRSIDFTMVKWKKKPEKQTTEEEREREREREGDRGRKKYKQHFTLY